MVMIGWCLLLVLPTLLGIPIISQLYPNYHCNIYPMNISQFYHLNGDTPKSSIYRWDFPWNKLSKLLATPIYGTSISQLYLSYIVISKLTLDIPIIIIIIVTSIPNILLYTIHTYIYIYIAYIYIVVSIIPTDISLIYPIDYNPIT